MVRIHSLSNSMLRRWHVVSLLLALVALLPGCGSRAVGNVEGADTVPELGFIPEGAIWPEPETISNFEYPLARPLFIYVNKGALTRPEVAAFLQHFFSEEGQRLVGASGYSPLGAEDLRKSRADLAEALRQSGVAVVAPLKGTFKIDGSSTVFPVSQAVAETFMRRETGVNVTVNYTGTGTGFKMLSTGEVEIAGASRAIKSGELEACAAQMIEVLELKFGIDGLSVVVHPENSWVEGLTLTQLRRIWEPDSRIRLWSDIDPAWPDHPILICGPGDESGTFDYFTEAVVGELKKCRKDYQSSPNDNTTVNIVSGNKFSLGYFGYAYLVENQDKVKALCIAR